MSGLSTAISISSKTPLSRNYLYSACVFARGCNKIEKQYTGNYDEQLYEEDMAYSIGSVIMSAFFLESHINELFSQVKDETEFHPLFGKINKELIERLRGFQVSIESNIDKKGIDRYTVLEKYQLFLFVSNKPLLDKGRNPFQDTQILVTLRHNLAHYKPKLVSVVVSGVAPEMDKPHPMEKKLRGKFPENCFYKDMSNPFYPEKCFGYGCAEWSVNTCKSFINQFYSIIGVPCWIDFTDKKYDTKI